jgi:hypothetical protein
MSTSDLAANFPTWLSWASVALYVAYAALATLAAITASCIAAQILTADGQAPKRPHKAL